MKVIYHIDVREEITDKIDTEYVNKYTDTVEKAVQDLFARVAGINPNTVTVNLEVIKEDQ